MSYTIENLQEDLNQKFGGQFRVDLVQGMALGGKGKSGGQILTLKRVGEPQHRIQFNRLGGLPKGSRLQGFRAGSDVAFDASDDLTITADTGTTFNLKRVGKVLIEALEAANTDFPQQLLMARNEIAYELEREKEKYAGEPSLSGPFDRACGELLQSVDKLCVNPVPAESSQVINEIHKRSKKIMKLNDNIPGLDRAISGFLLVAIFAGLALAIAGWVVTVPVVAITGFALMGVGMFGGFVAYGSSRGQSLTDGLVMQVSTLGRLTNRYCSLFQRHEKASQTAPEPVRLSLQG